MISRSLSQYLSLPDACVRACLCLLVNVFLRSSRIAQLYTHCVYYAPRVCTFVYVVFCFSCFMNQNRRAVALTHTQSLARHVVHEDKRLIKHMHTIAKYLRAHMCCTAPMVSHTGDMRGEDTHSKAIDMEWSKQTQQQQQLIVVHRNVFVALSSVVRAERVCGSHTHRPNADT